MAHASRLSFSGTLQVVYVPPSVICPFLHSFGAPVLVRCRRSLQPSGARSSSSSSSLPSGLSSSSRPRPPRRLFCLPVFLEE